MQIPSCLSVVLAFTITSSASAQINHALVGTATQSSTGFNGVASRAIDGNTDPNYFNGSITHTNDVPNSWWEVDLGAVVSISELLLHNRGDCCHTRLSNFHLSIWDGSMEVFGEDYFTMAGSVPSGGQHSVLPPGGTMGDRVRVDLLGNNLDGNGFLSLAEVEVYGPSAIGIRYCSPNVANTTGLPGVLEVFGSSMVASNFVTLTASDLPFNQFGIFLVGPAASFIPGPGGAQGNLCLGGGIGRYNSAAQVGNSGAGGSFSLALDLTVTPSPVGPFAVVPNQTLYFQAWYRDFITGQGAISNFTDAVQVDFL